MSGLTTEQRKKLSDLISQYGISLTRQADEKAIRKSIEETVKTIFELTRLISGILRLPSGKTR